MQCHQKEALLKKKIAQHIPDHLVKFRVTYRCCFCQKAFLLQSQYFQHLGRQHGLKRFAYVNTKPSVEPQTPFYLLTSRQTKIFRRLCRDSIQYNRAACEPCFDLNVPQLVKICSSNLDETSKNELINNLHYRKKQRTRIGDIVEQLKNPINSVDKSIIELIKKFKHHIKECEELMERAKQLKNRYNAYKENETKFCDKNYLLNLDEESKKELLKHLSYQKKERASMNDSAKQLEKELATLDMNMAKVEEKLPSYTDNIYIKELMQLVDCQKLQRVYLGDAIQIIKIELTTLDVDLPELEEISSLCLDDKTKKELLKHFDNQAKAGTSRGDKEEEVEKESEQKVKNARKNRKKRNKKRGN